MKKHCSTNESYSDDSLMQQVAKGDNDAFDCLYIRHSRRLCGFFIRMLGCSIDEAKDLTQDLFTRIYINRFIYKVNTFEAWLYGAAYNICKNEYRRREIRERYKAEQPKEEPATDPARDADNKSTIQELNIIVDALPQRQREAFILRYIEDLSISEISNIIGCPRER